MDPIVNEIKINIESNSESAVKSLNQVAAALAKIESATKGLKLSSSLGNQLTNIGNAAKNFDADKIAKVVDGISKLNNVKVSSTIATQIGKISEAFSKIDDSTSERIDKVTAALSRLNNISASAPKTKDIAPSAPQTPGANLSGSEQIAPKTSSENLDRISQSATSLRERLASLASGFGHCTASAAKFIGKMSTVAPIKLLGKGLKALGSNLGAVAKKFASFSKSTVFAPFKALGKTVGNVAGKLKELFSSFVRIAKYRAMRAALKAITQGFKEGTENLYQFSKAFGGDFAKSMDSIATESLYLKNSLGAMAGPLITALAPAIEYVIDKFVDLLNIINQTVAKLSGASTWTKALKYPKSFADSASDASGKVKELKRTLLGFDEINKLDDNKDSSGGSGKASEDYSKMFEVQNLEPLKIKNPFEGFFSVFKSAWDNEGQNTISAITESFKNIKTLFSEVGATFKTIFENGTGQETLETILRIIQSISGIAGNLAASFTKAWKANGNGEKIVQNLWNIFNDILTLIEKINTTTADWIAKTDLTPLLTAFAGLTGALEPLVNLIGNTLAYLYKTVMLPIAGWVIEEAAPASINAVSAAVEALNAILTPLLNSIQFVWDALSPVVEWIEGVALQAINLVTTKIQKLTSMFEKNGPKIQNIIAGVSSAFSAAWSVIEPIITLFAETILEKVGFAFEFIVTQVDSTISLFSGLIDFISGVFTLDWERAWNGIKDIFDSVWKKISGIAEGLKGFFSGIWASISSTATTVWWGISDFMVGIWDGISNNAGEFWNGIKSTILNVAEAIKTGVVTAFRWAKDKSISAFDALKNRALRIWDAIWSGISFVCNSMLGGIEAMVNGIISGLNWMIDALNKIQIKTPDWLGGKTFGFNIGHIEYITMPRLASGGIVDAGTMFIAGELGPEIVADIGGGRSGVMNNDQMMRSVSEGVTEANEEQNALLREAIGLMRQILAKDTNTYIDISANDIVDGLRRKNLKDGMTAVPV